jgi:hypothetical protein
MLETLSQYISAKNWSAIIDMHSSVSVQKVNNDYILISFHNAESSAITADEIADVKELGHFSDFNPYEQKNLLYVLPLEICGTHVTFFFNGTKKEHCPECDREINGRCGYCNNPNN